MSISYSSPALADRPRHLDIDELYRVFDDTSQALFHNDRGFVAPNYARYAQDPDFELEDMLVEPYRQLESDPDSYYSGIVDHVGYRQSTHWISTTSQWGWAVWEMDRRARRGTKKSSIRLAVLDARALYATGTEGRVVYALDILKRQKVRLGPGIISSTASEALSRAKNFANAAQEVLVFAHIPKEAILSVVTLEEAFAKLPQSYFVVSPDDHRLVWDTTATAYLGKLRHTSYADAKGDLVLRFRSVGWQSSESTEVLEVHARECAALAFCFLNWKYESVGARMQEILSCCEPCACASSDPPSNQSSEFLTPDDVDSSNNENTDLEDLTHLMGQLTVDTSSSVHPGSRAEDYRELYELVENLGEMAERLSTQIACWLAPRDMETELAREIQPAISEEVREWVARLEDSIIDSAQDDDYPPIDIFSDYDSQE
ncbi:hypothetical protein H0H92_005152 [Tricholoma furcatifolium]|nr:hypothetical protein H0H92_005152 [Tricholoma furcatifolium]